MSYGWPYQDLQVTFATSIVSTDDRRSIDPHVKKAQAPQERFWLHGLVLSCALLTWPPAARLRVTMNLKYTLRCATRADESTLRMLIEDSVKGLSTNDYTSTQIAAALQSAWGLDTQLVSDGTYFVADSPDAGIIGCGGWSRRKTLFGSDANPDRDPEMLDPTTDAARIRAFFVRPGFARQGIGRAILARCEDEALRQGFRRLELLATIPGHRLYKAFGYEGDKRQSFVLAGGIHIDFIPMAKRFASESLGRDDL